MSSGKFQAFRDAGAVLADGWHICKRGFGTIFPWVLAAELIPALSFRHPGWDSSTGDIEQFFDLSHFWPMLAWGVYQALIYCVAVSRLPVVMGEIRPSRFANVLRATPVVFIDYVVYQVFVITGLLISLLFFSSGLVLLGPVPALLIVLIPLAPTAFISTALSLFIYPAVIENKGPLEALSWSWRLTKSSWGCVALVISVPAIVLLLVVVGENAPTVIVAIKKSMQLASEISTDTTESQMEAMAVASIRDIGEPSVGWHLAWTTIGAIAWWYTLAVCYAQYRYLRLREPH